jgi:uncharacterized membrane protein YccF (DUF307 family)
MPPIAIVLNLLWLICGGLWMAIAWGIASVLMALTIVGLPWTRAAFNIAVYTFLPFGQRPVSRAAFLGREDLGTGVLGTIGNILWLLFAGLALAVMHAALALLLAMTIIGLPFAWANLKLAAFALWPVGRMVVPVHEAYRIGWVKRA